MFKGVIPAIVTPMQQDGSFDPGAMAEQVARHLDAGAGGIFCGGTNGEFYALSRAELVEVAEATVSAARGSKVIAGTAFGAVADTAELTRAYAEVGVDAVSMLTPYFVDVTQEGMAEYFEAVADASALPLVLYNIPGKARNDLEAETVGRLAKHENIAAIKDSSGKLDKVKGFAAQPGIQTMTGSDGLILAGLELGLEGFVSGFSNVAPAHVYGIVKAYRDGRVEEARAHQEAVGILRDMLAYGNPGTVTKRSAALQGEQVGPSRAPCRVAPGEIDDALIEIMARAGITVEAAA
ncbi:4-hydroxy-tetrahydrodipicolinate synthase [Aliiruegeria haliotis]|uniref:4-hydroxy-tetrahydrodipicolinate synthase n=1 Tax=Aliiruegeria haliotis TaxID=1280846 RepID=A0A2T0RG00_9RHOB|nr:dihydrodipicolinate synthase family protein [Aliiruegeria haliotis]PRY20077.1 4-hydroxy-tetrahydrodipicolinate synthase [Aliiruegeria haliotis]